MKLLVLLLIVGALASASVGSAAAPAPAREVFASALHAMRAPPGSAHLAHGGRIAVVVSGSQEVQWSAYVAASVYAARGNPLRSVRFVRRKNAGGDVTLGFPAVNCACAYPGMRRLGKVKPASRDQVVSAIETAAARTGAHVVRIELPHPLAYAPIIVVDARDPWNFLRLGKAAELVGKLEGRIEGAYVIVRDRHGRFVRSGGYTARSYTTYGEVGWAVPD